MCPIKEFAIFRNNDIVHQIAPGTERVALEWTDPTPLDTPLSWYYVRIQAEDDELAWSSPIWFGA